jgi:hypothetical protein
MQCYDSKLVRCVWSQLVRSGLVWPAAWQCTHLRCCCELYEGCARALPACHHCQGVAGHVSGRKVDEAGQGVLGSGCAEGVLLQVLMQSNLKQYKQPQQPHLHNSWSEMHLLVGALCCPNPVCATPGCSTAAHADRSQQQHSTLVRSSRHAVLHSPARTPVVLPVARWLGLCW